MIQPHKLCPKCHHPANLHDAYCPRCGHQYRTQFDDRTQVVLPPASPPPAPQNPLPPWRQPSWIQDDGTQTQTEWIVVMWGATIATVFLMLNGMVGFGLLLALGAVLIAIWLLSTRSETNKAHGWVKISLEVLGFVIAFIMSSGRSH